MIEIVNINDNWPGGISDGLTLPCGLCKKIPALDYTVTDTAWQAVVPKELQLGVVCLSCFQPLAQTRAVYLSDVLLHVQFTGEGETILLHPSKAYRYGSSVISDKCQLSPLPCTHCRVRRLSALTAAQRNPLSASLSNSCTSATCRSFSFVDRPLNHLPSALETQTIGYHRDSESEALNVQIPKRRKPAAQHELFREG